MGLIGMARRAGRAHGDYLAAQEDYHRNRQAMLDDMMRQRFDMDRTAFAGNQAWLAKSRAQQEQQWTDAAEDRKTFGIPMAQSKLQSVKLANDAAAANLEAKNVQRMRNDELYGRMMRAYDQLSPEDQQSFDLGLMQMARRNAGNTGNTGKAKPEISDTRIENTAKNISPALVKSAFIREFEADDKDIQRRTGKNGNAIKPEEYYNSLAAEYAHHVRTAGGNALPLDEFVLRKGVEHGFRSRWDMAKYFRAKQDKGSPTMRKWLNSPLLNNRLGTWHPLYILADRATESGTDRYARKNPTAYSMQKNIENELTATLGKDAVPFLRDPALVRAYYMGRNRKGYKPADAVRYAYSVQSGGVR